MKTETRICKGPRHREGKELPIDSFASSRSNWCRGCMSDYDKQRGRFRGARRGTANGKNNNDEKPEVKLTMAKNTELPGMVGAGVERVQIPAVDESIDDYVIIRNRRMKLTEQEVEAKQRVITVMREHIKQIGADKDGNMVYRHDDLLVTLRHGKDELKVRSTAEENPEETL